MTPDVRPADLPEIIGGRYRVLSELGRGGMGRVLKVSHLHTGEALAMKLLIVPANGRDRAVERFKREARTLAQVRGDHVVRVMDADLAPELDGSPYLVTELLEGEDLGRAVNRRGRLSAAEALPILWQVAQGLSRVHRAGLVHRDLKPANIFLHQHDGRAIVKLLDFGLVRQAGRPEGPHDAVTAHGEILGTPLFMSPEQIHGTPESVGTATDIWAAGMLTYYLMTGLPYWNMRDLPRGVYDIGTAPLTPPSLQSPLIPVAFDAWFLRSCARNPASRWPDPAMQVQELALALGLALDPSSPIVLSDVPRPAASGEETHIASATPPSATPAPSQPGASTSGRQRRQVTVLFYRLVHSAGAADEMDPEEFEASEARLHARLDPALGDLRQTSHQLARGGRFVFFGYPVAYGGDARRAIDAAHRLVARAAEINAELKAASAGGLQIRIGIHTGVVLAGPSTDMPGSAEIVGQALGVATDLEHGAQPGQVVVSDATWRLVRDRFDAHDLGENRYLITGASSGASAATESGLRLVGRDAELGILQSCLADARGGQSQMVLITGEVGIGKSRLVQALRSSVEADGARWFECQSSPYFQRTAFHPVLELLSQTAASVMNRPPSARLSIEDVRGLVRAVGLGDEVADSLAFLLPPTGPDQSALAGLSPQLRRERAIQGLVALMQQLSDNRPVVLVVEDLHWADPSTLEWLDRLSVIGSSRVLTVLTARPDFAPSWSAPGQVTPVQLRRLGKAQTAQLVAQVAGGALTPDLADLVAQTTDGIPLFIEELARLVAERPASSSGSVLSSMSVPTSLSEALGARLDRLGSARTIAELAAVVGMTFSLDDVKALAGDDGSVPAKLQELVRAKIVQPLGLPPHTSYAFQHALLREAAYGSLPKPTRRRLHLAVAQALSGRSGTLPEVLAHHFEEGGQAMAAAGLLLQAGQEALARSANAEARAHFQRGADILDKYARSAAPDEPPVDPALDITLRTLHGMAWVVSKGWAATEAAQSFAGAMARVHALGDRDVPGSIPALWANWVYFFVTGRMADAAEQGARLRRAADRSGDPGAIMMANLAEGTVLFDQAKFGDAVAHLDAALAAYNPQAHTPYRFMYGQDPKMYGMVFKAWALWCTGASDEAARLADEAVAHAAGLHHPNSHGFALGISGIIHQCRGDLEALSARVATLFELSAQQGWMQWLGLAKLLGGAADVMRGRVQAGVDGMTEARMIGRMIGEKSGATHYDALLADGLCRAGRLDEAAQLLTAVRAGVAETGGRAFEADVLRLEGEVARLRGDRAGARRLFMLAAETGAATGARAYVERAEASLRE